MNKIFAEKVGVGLVVAVPGELDVAAAIVGIILQSAAIGLRPGSKIIGLSDRLERVVRLMLSGREHVGDLVPQSDPLFLAFVNYSGDRAIPCGKIVVRWLSQFRQLLLQSPNRRRVHQRGIALRHITLEFGPGVAGAWQSRLWRPSRLCALPAQPGQAAQPHPPDTLARGT